MKKQRIIISSLIFIIFCITISNVEAYTNMLESPNIECISYNIWGFNNSRADGLRQVNFESPDTFYMVGVYIPCEDVFLVKFNESETSLEELNCSLYEWGGANLEDFGEFVIDSTDNIYITGFTSSFGAGDNDIFLTKLDKSGQSLWNRTWGYSDFDAIDSELETNKLQFSVLPYTDTHGLDDNTTLNLEDSSSSILDTQIYEENLI